MKKFLTFLILTFVFSVTVKADYIWSPLGSGVNGRVYAITVNGEDVYAGGVFTTAGGNNANRIAKWDGSMWSPLGDGVNGTVNAICVNGTDVYVGGSFTLAGSTNVNNIAKWDGVNWTALGSGLNGEVFAIAVQGSTIYAGGNFTTAGGNDANYIAMWNGTSWTPLGTGLNGLVKSITVSENEIYVTGHFTIAGGVLSNIAAMWDGVMWQQLGSPTGLPTDGYGSTSSIIEDKLYTAGPFGGFVNPYDKFNLIAGWDGTEWFDLDYGIPISFSYPTEVKAITALGNDLYVGGSFLDAGFISARNIARWGGHTWSAIGDGVLGGTYPIYAIASGDNCIYVGGDISLAGGNNGIPVNNIAKLNPPLTPLAPANLILMILPGSTAQLTWIPVSGNGDGFVIERKDNVDTNWTAIDSVGISQHYYKDFNLIIGRTYYWRLFSYNEHGNSPYSNVVTTLITDVNYSNEQLPFEYSLSQNYPNPFNPVTTLKFSLPISGHIKLTVFDALGREIQTLVNETLQPGNYSFNFDASQLTSGVYYYSLVVDSYGETEGFIETKRAVLIK